MGNVVLEWLGLNFSFNIDFSSQSLISFFSFYSLNFKVVEIFVGVIRKVVLIIIFCIGNFCLGVEE